MKYKHLTLDDRIEIQKALKEKVSFVKISNLLHRDASTISKEVRAHAKKTCTGTRARPYNPCVNRNICKSKGKMCKKCFDLSKNVDRYYCAKCVECINHCDYFREEHCIKLAKPPYVCNGCIERRTCTLEKNIYDAKEAQKEYETVRSESRQGIALETEELERIDKIISPLIRQGQSIHHICRSKADEIMLDERTIYNYVDAGLLSIGNIDLPRKVRYKKRKVKRVVHVDKQCHEGRTYRDYLNYMAKNPDVPVVQMDSVEGSRDSTKVLLTLYFTSCSFMLAFLRDANTARSVAEIFDNLDQLLGRRMFRKMFPVILADRGSEFTDPLAIEVDRNGEIRTRLFYCDPQRPDQKGSVEVTHEFIRRILPKKTSFAFLSQEKVDLMMSHINSYARKKLSDRSPHQLFSFFYGIDTALKLHSQLIETDQINLTPNLLK